MCYAPLQLFPDCLPQAEQYVEAEVSKQSATSEYVLLNTFVLYARALQLLCRRAEHYKCIALPGLPPHMPQHSSVPEKHI